MREYGGNKTITKNILRLVWVILPLLMATACASVDIPDGRSASVPTITPPNERFEGLNEKQDPVTRVHLGRDVLMPQPVKEDPLPDTMVGPYELRGETLASALQLILDDYDISLAFETDEGLKRKVTIANLHGKLSDVIHKVCSVADLYCHFEAGTLTVKKTETFVVDLPPINKDAPDATAGGGGGSSGGSSSGGAAAPAAGGSSSSSGSSSSASVTTAGPATANDAYTQIASGLTAVLAMETDSAPQKVTIDNTTRVLIYSATQRGSKAAKQYFDRLRKNTALIIFETHIWEVTLNNDNQTGINWGGLANKTGITALGHFGLTSVLANTLPQGVGGATPITITPSYTGGNFSANFILQFLSEHGTVKTISQPQITVLSGSKASIAITQQDNYVSNTSTSAGNATTGATASVGLGTSTLNTGLSLNVSSAWDQSTVYGAISIDLQDLVRIDTFNTPDNTQSVQLPHTTSRSLSTEVRVRPGDAILIGGLVSQTDQLTTSGLGILTPFLPTDRTANKINTELVFLLRPRVVAFVMGDDSDTPKIVDAPKDGILPPAPSDKGPEPVNSVSAETPALPPQPVSKNVSNNKAALPAGISPEAFAPQGTPASPVNEDLPASLQEQQRPVPLSGKPVDGSNNKKPADGNMGVPQ